jgi:hypothetical protein
MANLSGLGVFISPGNNLKNTKPLKSNIWLAGGKLADPQSKQVEVTLCRTEIW